MIKRASIRLFFFLLALVFFVVGIEALFLAKSENKNDTFNRITGNISPYVSRDFENIAKLERSVAEYKRRLEFASYPDERKKIGRKLLEIAQIKVNLRPFEKDNWLELVRLQQVADAKPRIRVFTARNALFIGGWKSEYRANIGLICIESPPVLIEYGDNFCHVELKNLRSPEAQKTLFLQGIPLRDVNLRLDQIEVQFCLVCKKK